MDINGLGAVQAAHSTYVLQAPSVWCAVIHAICFVDENPDSEPENEMILVVDTIAVVRALSCIALITEHYVFVSVLCFFGGADYCCTNKICLAQEGRAVF